MQGLEDKQLDASKVSFSLNHRRALHSQYSTLDRRCLPDGRQPCCVEHNNSSCERLNYREERSKLANFGYRCALELFLQLDKKPAQHKTLLTQLEAAQIAQHQFVSFG